MLFRSPDSAFPSPRWSARKEGEDEMTTGSSVSLAAGEQSARGRAVLSGLPDTAGIVLVGDGPRRCRPPQRYEGCAVRFMVRWMALGQGRPRLAQDSAPARGVKGRCWGPQRRGGRHVVCTQCSSRSWSERFGPASRVAVRTATSFGSASRAATPAGTPLLRPSQSPVLLFCVWRWGCFICSVHVVEVL